MSDKPFQVSTVPPLPARGVFKIEKHNDRIMIATSKKVEYFALIPSHACDPHTKEWLSIEEKENKKQNVLSKLSTPSKSVCRIIPLSIALPGTWGRVQTA